ncbi:polysaccharide deacetylase [Minicystis rosea]|nr:polysaccharide deacetylase [Minicystis rosea]
MRTAPRSFALARFAAALLALAASACAKPPSIAAPVLAPVISSPSASIAEDAGTMDPPAVPAPAESVAPPSMSMPEVPEPPPFAAAPRAEVRAVVLVYHLFGGMDTEMAVEPAAFEQQLAWLVDHHIAVIGTSDLVSFLAGERDLPARAAVIQIDDGHVSTHGKAFPALLRHGLRFTLALNTEAIEGHRPEAVTWDAVREMLSSGLCEIASHSHIHGHMDRLTDARNQSEAMLSRSILEARTGVRPEAFVYPFGGNDKRVRHTIEDAGYRAAFGVSGGAARASSPRFEVPRIGVTRSMSLTAFARLFGETVREARAGGARTAGRG